MASIATALASFNRLRREMGDDYPGGLLVIDELDAGFHPHAIDRLIQELKKQAKQLSLQVIATTHSPRLIEAVHPDGGGNANAPDKVAYLLDTLRPRLAEDQSLAAILNDMSLVGDEGGAKPAKPMLSFYFEDKEAEQFFDALFPSAKRAGLGRRLGIRIKLIALGIGGSQLVALPNRDPVFKDRMLVVDADTKIPRAAATRGNTVKLPRSKGATGTDRSPENTIRLFLRQMADADGGPMRTALLALNVPNPTTDRILSSFFADGTGQSSDRENAKDWWKTHWKKIARWKVIEQWAKVNAAEVQVFIDELEAATARTAARIKASSVAKSRSTT